MVVEHRHVTEKVACVLRRGALHLERWYPLFLIVSITVDDNNLVILFIRGVSLVILSE